MNTVSEIRVPREGKEKNPEEKKGEKMPKTADDN